MSLVVCKYPAELFNFLQDYPVKKFDKGIYYIGNWAVPIQVIVSEELREKDYLLLTALCSTLEKSKIERTFSAIAERRPQVGLDAYFEVFVNSNFQTIEEIENMKSLYQQAVKKWLTEGEVKGKAESVLTVLQNRFKRVPKNVQDKVRSYTDLTVLDSLLQSALGCKSLAEFSDWNNI